MFEGVNHEGSVAMLPVLAGEQGFEPRYADPESAVLPLDDSPKCEHFTRLRRNTQRLLTLLYLVAILVLVI